MFGKIRIEEKLKEKVMKVNGPYGISYWWHGAKLHCKCGLILTLEPGDGEPDNVEIYVTCPCEIPHFVTPFADKRTPATLLIKYNADITRWCADPDNLT